MGPAQVQLLLIAIDRISSAVMNGAEMIEKIKGMSDEEANAALDVERAKSIELKAFFESELGKTSS